MSNLDRYVTHSELEEVMQSVLSGIDEMFKAQNKRMDEMFERHENRIMMRIENGLGMQIKASGEALESLQMKADVIEDKVNAMEEHVATLTESVQYVKDKAEQIENGGIDVQLTRK